MKELTLVLTVVALIGIVTLMLTKQEESQPPLTVVGVCERFGMQATNISCLVYGGGEQECTYECWPVSQADDEE